MEADFGTPQNQAQCQWIIRCPMLHPFYQRNIKNLHLLKLWPFIIVQAESFKPVSPALPSHTEPAPNPALLAWHPAQPEPPEGPC